MPRSLWRNQQATNSCRMVRPVYSQLVGCSGARLPHTTWTPAVSVGDPTSITAPSTVMGGPKGVTAHQSEPTLRHVSKYPLPPQLRRTR